MAVRFSEVAPPISNEMRYEPRPQRVRVSHDGRPVADTYDAWLVWEPRRVVPRYALPASDFVADLETGDEIAVDLAELPPLVPPNVTTYTTPGTEVAVVVDGERVGGSAYRPADPDLADRIVLDHAPFSWHEEEQEVIGHPRDPFKRIDCLPTSRHVTFALDGVTLADSTRPVLLLETHLPPRWYLPPEDVQLDLLTPSDTTSVCAYKGVASYLSHAPSGDDGADIAWSYPEPLNDAAPVRDLVCFYAERLDVTVDGVALPRPRTQWSR
ncbi:DUF427 domain-containing protein [Nocardioides panacisoli]|uniref:DUF427 domain-containing protein n=1 Tax=Nocardioides panacisoli TaxID=627624 RepID=UPI001C62D161|nr:DUF427 domain-containing protein [Nocardioides panacisoli]QYJ05409.1 DUF427 domain-containing protein [Nocardioides panacisoli]